MKDFYVEFGRIVQTEYRLSDTSVTNKLPALYRLYSITSMRMRHSPAVLPDAQKNLDTTDILTGFIQNSPNKLDDEIFDQMNFYEMKNNLLFRPSM